MTAKHDRQLIREAVKAQLLNKTAAQGRVYETRIVPFGRLELPAVAVYTLSESSDDRQTAPRELKRTLQLAIEAAVKTGDNIDDAMDAISLEVENAINADETFGGVASDSLLTSTELDVAEKGDQFVGLARLVYSVVYYTEAQAADGALSDLKTVDIRTNLSGAVDSGNQAEDKLESLDEE